MQTNRARWTRILWGAAAAAFTSTLTLPADAQMCTPQRQERTAYQVTGSCCVFINPSNGLPVSGGERLYRKQYRDRLPNCSWTEWTFFGPHWTKCNSSTACWYNASFAPREEAERPAFAVEGTGTAERGTVPPDRKVPADEESTLFWRPDPGVCLL